MMLMNTPNFLAYKIIEMEPIEMCNTTTDTGNRDTLIYIPGVSDLALEAHCLVFIFDLLISLLNALLRLDENFISILKSYRNKTQNLNICTKLRILKV